MQGRNGMEWDGWSDDIWGRTDNEGLVLGNKEEQSEGYVLFTEMVAEVLLSPSI